jgi:hypothetical protein
VARLQRPVSTSAASQADAGTGEPGLGLGLSILRRLDERYGLGLRIEWVAGEMVAGFELGRM